MILDEKLFEEAEETGKTENEFGVTSILMSLIKDEYEAIEGYNSFIATLTDISGYEDMINLAQHIIEEEYQHIGELTEMLKQVSPEAENQEIGQEDAQEEIGTEEEVDEI